MGLGYDNMGLKKGPWTPEEDEKLIAYIQQHGHQRWRTLPTKAGLKRCGKSCRLRWINYLRPDIKRGKFTLQEENTIIQLHALIGNRWSTIASHLPKRTDNEIKNYWNTYLKKKLTKMGIDPITHRPKNHTLSCTQSKDFANLCHAAQWESARLEAEARLSRNSTVAPPAPPCLDILQVRMQNMNHVEMSKMDLAGQPFFHCYQDEAKGIMENSVDTHAADSSGFVGYVDLPPTVDTNVIEDSWNVLEGNNNVNYWGRFSI